MEHITELNETFTKIENEINNCSNPQTYKFVRGRITRARTLIRSLRLTNKGLPSNQQINVQPFQQKVDDYDVQLAKYATNCSF
jgi:hypothetical protein